MPNDQNPDEKNPFSSVASLHEIADAINNEKISSQPQQLANEERNDFEHLKRERYSSDTSDRKWLAQWTATIVSIWLFSVVGILICNDSKFHLSDMVLSVLLGTTTLNVLGLSFIVLRGHFQSHSEMAFEQYEKNSN